MRGKHSPRGLWFLAALALLLGVGSLTPVSAWAEADQDDDNSGIFNPPRGGVSPEPGGGEADPDWWQTDVWDDAEIVALPATDSRRAPETRRVLQYVENPIHAFIQWLERLGGHHLGF